MTEIPGDAPADQPASDPGGAGDSSGGSRQTLALVLAGALGVLVVIAVLIVTLKAGDEPATTADGQIVATTAPPAPVSLPPELEDPIVVPEGDYTQFCAELLRQTADFSASQGIEEMRSQYRDVDFDALIPLAPVEMVPTIETIRDDRDQVLVALDQIDDLSELAFADVPEGFLRAAATLSAAYTQECVAAPAN